jgi:hypothetical protein
MAYLRAHGWTAKIVEHWNHYAKVRQDLWGADIIAICHGMPHMLVQTTTADNAAKRRAKVLASNEARIWVETGGRFTIHAWGKRGARGKRKLWSVVATDLSIGDFAAAVHNMPSEYGREYGKAEGDNVR